MVVPSFRGENPIRDKTIQSEINERYSICFYGRKHCMLKPVFVLTLLL